MPRIIRNMRKRIRNLRGFELNEVVINGRIFELHFKKRKKTKEQKTSKLIDILMNR